MPYPPTSKTNYVRTPYWQQPHLGRLLGYALQRFDERVLELMIEDDETPLALSNLARHQQISAAHIHITRHLPPEGARQSKMAKQANMTRQAINTLVSQCEAWGIVERVPDPQEARAKLVQYTQTGLAWLHAFTRAVTKAEEEFKIEIGAEVATVIQLGLEMYASNYEKSA